MQRARFDVKPDDIRLFGEAAYGGQWKRPLAHALFAFEDELGVKVDERRVYGWARGEYKIPPTLGDVLDAIAIHRLEEIKSWRTFLRDNRTR